MTDPPIYRIDATMLRILGLIAQRSDSTIQLAIRTDLTRGTINDRVRTLQRAGLVMWPAPGRLTLTRLGTEYLAQQVAA